MRVLFVDLGDTRGELNEPLGIECISSRIIRELPVQVDLFWYAIETPKLEQFLKYDVIGLSMSIGTMERFRAIYTFIRMNRPELPIILGGVVPTFAYRQLLDEYDNVICSYGEGEDSIFDIVKLSYDYGLAISSRLQTIPNLAYKMKGKIIVTHKQPVDLSCQKPVIRNDRLLAAIHNRYGIVRVEGSRGCSWNRCAFCCVNAKYADPSWRPFPLEKIVNELQELSAKGFYSPYFTDEDFFGQDYKRSIELAKRIIAYKENGLINPQMNFFVSILASDATNLVGQEALIVWKKAGLREVFLGIESFEQEQLKRFCKKATADTNKKAIEFVKSIGLQIDSGYILFDPQLSFEALGKNIEYIQSLQLNKIDSRSLKRLRLQPMTTISDNMSEMIIGKLDIDNLEYPYAFQDERVAEIYAIYKHWEDIELTHVWTIQAASRGEIDEKLRIQLKSILSLIRDIDFMVLKAIYSHFSSLKDDPYVIPNTILQQKKEYIKMALDLIQAFRTI